MINQLILNGIIAGSVYILVAVGLTVIYRTVKFFHFAHGVVCTAGAYFTKNNISISPKGEQIIKKFVKIP